MSKSQKQRCSTAMFHRNHSAYLSPNSLLKNDRNCSQKNSSKNIQLPVLQKNDLTPKPQVKTQFLVSNFKKYFQPLNEATTNFISHNCSIESIQSILPQNTIINLEKALTAFSQSVATEKLTQTFDQNAKNLTNSINISNSTRKNGELFILKWESFILHFIQIWNSGHKPIKESIESKLEILNTIITTIETALRQTRKRNKSNDMRKPGDTNTIHDQVLQSCQRYRTILDTLNSNFEKLFSLINTKKLWIQPTSNANQNETLNHQMFNNSNNKLMKISSDIQSPKNDFDVQYLSENKLVKNNSDNPVTANSPIPPNNSVFQSNQFTSNNTSNQIASNIQSNQIESNVQSNQITSNVQSNQIASNVQSNNNINLNVQSNLNNSNLIKEVADNLCDSTRDLSRKMNESFLHEFSQLGLQDVMMLRTAAVSTCSDLIREFKSSVVYDDDLLQISLCISTFKQFLRDICIQFGLKSPNDHYEFKYEIEPQVSNFNLFDNCTLLELIKKATSWYLTNFQTENIAEGQKIQKILLKKVKEYQIEMNNKLKEQQNEIDKLNSQINLNENEIDLNKLDNEIELEKMNTDLEKEKLNEIEKQFELTTKQLTNQFQSEKEQLQNEILQLKQQNEKLKSQFDIEKEKLQHEILQLKQQNKDSKIKFNIEKEQLQNEILLFKQQNEKLKSQFDIERDQLETKLNEINKKSNIKHELVSKSIQTEGDELNLIEKQKSEALQRIESFRKSFQFIIGPYQNHIDKTDDELIQSILLNYKNLLEQKQDLEQKINSLSVEVSNKKEELQSKQKQIFDIQSNFIEIESSLFKILKPSELEDKPIENTNESIKRIKICIDILKELDKLISKNDFGLIKNIQNLVDKLNCYENDLSEIIKTFDLNSNEISTLKDVINQLQFNKTNSEIDDLKAKNDKLNLSIEKIINSLEVHNCEQIEFDKQEKETIAVYAVNAIVDSIQRNTNKRASPFLSLDAYFEDQNKALQEINQKIDDCLAITNIKSNNEKIDVKIDLLYSKLQNMNDELKSKNAEIEQIHKEKNKNVQAASNVPFVTLRKIDSHLCKVLGIQTVRDTDLQTHVFDLIESVEKRLMKFSNFSHHISELFDVDPSLPLNEISKSIDEIVKQKEIIQKAGSNLTDKEIVSMFAPIFELIDLSNKNDPHKFLPEFVQAFKTLYDSISCLKPLLVILNKIFDEFDSRTVSSFDTSSSRFRLYNGYVLEMRTVLQSMYPTHADSLVFSVASKLVSLITSLTTVLASMADASFKTLKT